MPARASTRTPRPPRNVKSTAAAPEPVSASNATAVVSTIEAYEEPPSSLRTNICRIFADAQRSAVAHRKLAVNLRRIQEECCVDAAAVATKRKDKRVDEGKYDEEAFTAEVERCVVRLMAVKRGETVADRVVRFLGLFLRYAGDKDHALVASDATESPSTRLTSRILTRLLPMLAAKEKTVRYRATQVISHIINSVDSIDDDLFQSLRLALLKRIRDKESAVRVQAVLGLGRLAGNEGDDEPDDDDHSHSDGGGDDGGALLERLLRVLQHDPSADVRRSLLLNLPIMPTTLPFLLERARDQDAVTRRALYARLLPALGDFRHLSLSMREKLLRWGFRDRDDGVRKAAARLFRERWIEDCAGTLAAAEAEADNEEAAAAAAPVAAGPRLDALLEMLERIDVVNSGGEEGVALEAMQAFWAGRPDYVDAARFDDAFWDRLTAESAFMARTFHDFGRQAHGPGRGERRFEDAMPEVTRLAFYVERSIEQLVAGIHAAAATDGRDADADVNADDDERVEQVFIVEQLLQIALGLDYADEVGRRKMFTLMRDSLARAELPDEATRLVVDVLRTVCGADAGAEREFCRVVLEAISDVHDTIAGSSGGRDGGDDVPSSPAPPDDDSFHSARSELADSSSTLSAAGAAGSEPGTTMAAAGSEERLIHEIVVNMKCLHIAQCMLENVQGSLQQNGHLVSMLNSLVVPAVRSHEAPLRERGLLCLGLCCLLDKTLAEENLSLFLHCFHKGHDALQVYGLQIVCDILLTHGMSILDGASAPLSSSTTDPPPQPHHRHPILKMFTKGLLKMHDQPAVQASACTALCKLMLGGIVREDEVLKALVVAYFDPHTAPNVALRQALSYFLPVYCHSRSEHQDRMQRVAVPALHALTLVHAHAQDEDDDGDDGDRHGTEMVGLAVIAAHLVDWTDARKVVVVDGGAGVNRRKDGAGAGPGVAAGAGALADVPLRLARDLLEKIVSATCSRDEKKILVGMLHKLHLTSHLSPSAATALLPLVAELARRAVDEKVVADVASRNALLKTALLLEKLVDEAQRAHPPAAAVTPTATATATVAASAAGSDAPHAPMVVVPDAVATAVAAAAAAAAESSPGATRDELPDEADRELKRELTADADEDGVEVEVKRSVGQGAVRDDEEEEEGEEEKEDGDEDDEDEDEEEDEGDEEGQETTIHDEADDDGHTSTATTTATGTTPTGGQRRHHPKAPPPPPVEESSLVSDLLDDDDDDDDDTEL
ncbi:MAG: hypothetical protein M1826_005974 [Phylliscum demangeonii]|nr:MAG: hypothetical protein M1826_005974 [Phylliscum demangeonii]